MNAVSPTTEQKSPSVPDEVEILRERALKLAERDADSIRESETRDFIVFRLGQEIYAIDAAKITGILQRCPVTPIPRTPSHFLGLSNHRGEPLGIFDLKSILSGSSTDLNESENYVVVGEEFAELGFPVDELKGVRSLKQESFHKMENASNEELSVTQGITTDAIALIDVSELLKSPKTRIDGNY